MAGSPIIAGDAVILACDQMSGSFMIALDRRTGRERWRRARPGITVSWTTPMVFAPGGGADPQLIVLSSTRLDGYTLATGEPRWWMPLTSQGAIGTAVAHGDMVIVATLGANEPWMEPFEAALKTFDTDKDGKLSRAEYATEKGFGEHFGWLDADGNDIVDKAEYDDARAMGIGEYGVAAIKPAGLKGKVDPNAAAWRFKKNLPFVPTPVVYDGLLYMVKTGGIITADRSGDRAGDQGRPQQGRARRLHGVTDRRRRQGVPRQRQREGHRAEGRTRVGGARRQRPRRRDPRDAGAERRTHLRQDARNALLLRLAKAPATRPAPAARDRCTAAPCGSRR